jgi:aryl-alcohol dehydrogenase-like predicted oxidoreductase
MILTGRLGTSDLIVSQLGMGCVKLGSVGALHSSRSARRLVRDAVDAGVRLFDTADAYGSGISEATLGEALAPVRDGVVVATKIGYLFKERSRLAQLTGGVAGAAVRRLDKVLPWSRSQVDAAGVAYSRQDFSAAYVRAAVIGSLRRLRTGHLDLLQFHGPPAPEQCALPEVISRLMGEGLVRNFGVGCEQLEVAEAWVDVPGLTSIQLGFGVLDPEAAVDFIPRARRAGVGIIARGVLGGGLLAQFVRGRAIDLDAVRSKRLRRLVDLATAHGTDVMQLAIWYGLYRAQVDAILLGISSAAQLEADVRMVGQPLSSVTLLKQITEIVEAAEA